MRIDRYGIGLLGFGLAARVAGYPFVSVDMGTFLIPWYLHLSQGGFPVIGTNFSNYSPPYLYLLWLASKVFGPAHPLEAIKCLSVACDVALCLAGTWLVKSYVTRPIPALRVFAIFWCIPTVIVNSAVWGQCDALYTALLVASLALTLSGPFAAMALFGVALSVKLQAIFVAPAIGALILARRLPWSAVAIGAAAALLMWMPAALAGRSWQSLFGIYTQQANTYHYLSLNAPNLWTIIVHRQWIPDSDFRATLISGLAAAFAVAMAYLALGYRWLKTADSRAILVLAFVAAFIFPFVLPQMHDRYFYPADVLSVALALCLPGWWLIAVLVQVGSLTAYGPFLLGRGGLVDIGVLANTLVCLLLLRKFVKARAWRLETVVAVPDIGAPAHRLPNVSATHDRRA